MNVDKQYFSRRSMVRVVNEPEIIIYKDYTQIDSPPSAHNDMPKYQFPAHACTISYQDIWTPNTHHFTMPVLLKPFPSRLRPCFQPRFGHPLKQ